MVKFVLFLIASLLILQNSYADLSEETEIEEALDEVFNLLFDIRNLTNRIAIEIIYYDSNNYMKITKLIEEFDMKSVYAELNDKIEEIYETEINHNTVAIFCSTDAMFASFDAWHEREDAVSTCSSKAKAISKGITTDLMIMWNTTNKLYQDLNKRITPCLNVDKDSNSEIDVKCLRDLANKFSPDFEVMDNKFEKSAPTMRTKADDSLDDMRKCLEQMKDFIKISDDIITTLKKCAKDNSATNIYSKNILCFCLCLFCILRMT